MRKQGTPRLLATVGVLALVTLVGASCTTPANGTTAPPTASANEPPDQQLAPVTNDGLDAHFSFPKFTMTVQASSGVAQAGDNLAATPQATPDEAKVPFYTDVPGPGVALALPNRAQPRTPLTVVFDYSKDPGAFAGLPATMVPAVLAQSDTVDEPDVLLSHWNPTTHQLTADTTHLTSFWPVLLDFGKLRDRLDGALNGYLGFAKGKPSCVGQPATVAGVTYAAQPVKRDVVWPCLSERDGRLVVTLNANSPLGWALEPTPRAAETHYSFPANLNDLAGSTYAAILGPVVGASTVLLPGGSTELVFDAANPPRQVGLRAEAGLTLVNNLMYAVHVAFPTTKIFEGENVVQCVSDLLKSPEYTDDRSGAGFGDLNKGLLKCLTLAVQHMDNSAGNLVTRFANSTVGSLLSMLPDGVTLLGTSLRGLIGEFTGENTATLTVSSSGEPPAASSAPTPDAAQPIRLELSGERTANGSGVKVAPNVFRLSAATGRYDMNYAWHLISPPPYGDRFCRQHIRITDSSGRQLYGYDQQDFNACAGGGAWASNTVITEPGTYTLTVDLEQVKGRPPVHGAQVVTVIAP